MRNFAHRSSRRSSALIITLITLSFLALVAVALAFVVRLDRTSARYFLEDSRASLLSDQGVNHAVALLRTLTATTNNSGTTNFWVVQPGQGYVSAGGGTQSQSLATVIPLSSGLGDPTNSDLNLASFQDPNNYAIDSSNAAPMKVQWIYVDKEGTNYTTTPPAFNASDPIVGRYGFWVDNENSRINLNTAFMRVSGSTNTLSPDNADLTALTGISSGMASAIHSYVTTTPLSSPDSMRLMNMAGLDPSLFNTNKFSTTYYNHDPDTTYWGAPKIVLTTQESRAKNPDGTTNLYLKILTSPNIDPGNFDDDAAIGWPPPNISDANLSATLAMLVSYLGRTDWPAAPSGNPTANYGNKFFGSGAAATDKHYQLMNMAVNIIDYVRSKESTNTFVVPTYGEDYNGAGWFYQPWYSYGYMLFGHTRKLHITEMGVWLPTDPTPPATITTDPVSGKPTAYTYYFPGYYVVELYWPANDGVGTITSYNLHNLVFNIQWTQNWHDYPANSGRLQGLTSSSAPPQNSTLAWQYPNGTTIGPAQYRTICIPMTYVDYEAATPSTTANPSPPPPPPRREDQTGQPMYLQAVIWDGTHAQAYDNALDEAGLWWQGPNMIPYNLDAANGDSFNSATYNGISSVQSDDYAVNHQAPSWTEKPNTFGLTNSVITQGKLPTLSATIPEQDTDSSGLITAAGEAMPSPKGQGSNPGYMESVAELGHVATGDEGLSGAPNAPYRTLHFQPMRNKGATAATAFLPDWELMDLFKVPLNTNTVNTSVAFSTNPNISNNAVAGRINLNAEVAPFESGTPSLGRIAPLTALFLNNPNYGGSASVAATMATNIYNHLLSTPNGQSYLNGAVQANTYGSKIYSMPGELAEIQGIADGGETSEANLQSVVDMATTQSNVFRIYSIGQALQQTKSNALSVTGEHRDCSIVERSISSTGAVSFHVIYHRNITF